MAGEPTWPQGASLAPDPISLPKLLGSPGALPCLLPLPALHLSCVRLFLFELQLLKLFAF